MIKKILKLIWDEFVYGGHLASMGVAGILWSTAIIFDKPVSISLLTIGYALGQIIGGYNHFKEMKRDSITNPERVGHITKTKKFISLLLIFYFLLFVVSAIYLKNLKSIIFAFFILIGGLFFTDIFKGFTKYIIGFKTFYVAFFMGSLAILSGFYYGIENNLLIFLLFLFIFLRLVVNTAFFDIKDIESDRKENLKTFPIILGEKKTISCLHLFNAFSFLPIIFGVYYNILPFFTLSFPLFYFYSFYYFKKVSNNENIRKLSYIMVDGEYLFWPIILFLFKFLWKI